MTAVENALRVLLIAEDDDDDRLLIAKALQHAKIPLETRFVFDGEELMEYLTRQGKYRDAPAPRPSLILLDLRMPRMDGLVALRTIKSNPQLREIPIVMLTTSQMDEDAQEAYLSGANAYITKPSTIAELSQVARAIRDHWFSVVTLPPI